MHLHLASSCSLELLTSAPTSSDASVPAFSNELFAPMTDNFVDLAKVRALSAFLGSHIQTEMLACCKIGTILQNDIEVRL